MVEFHNSHLAEYAPLGYEYGYSTSKPTCLTVWEAQFGDFANTAQVIIDQMIASGERKWGLMNGLTLLLPHGMEGMGPEHSSARLERFLELVDDNPHDPEQQTNNRRSQSLMINMQVANVTNPANYFHLLRRQLVRDFRKPLVVMTPKYLLRHKLVKSNIEEFHEKYHFVSIYRESYPEEVQSNEQIERVIFCSGKVYFDLLDKRREIQDKVIQISYALENSPHQNRRNRSFPILQGERRD